MLFNTARKGDFTPKFNIGGTDIETVDQLKLLGVQVTNDLKWNANTESIHKRDYNKLWILKRLKMNGANNNEIKIIYCQHVRSILEYASVVWHSGLTQENVTNIERFQKYALSIILYQL